MNNAHKTVCFGCDNPECPDQEDFDGIVIDGVDNDESDQVEIYTSDEGLA